MRAVQFMLAGVIAAVFAVAWIEPRPAMEDFDPQRHGQFADTWANRVHLSYWEKWSSFEADACQAMVDAFNRSQERVFVHYIRTSQVDRKAMLATIAGDPPDVLGFSDIQVIPFAEAGALTPLDDLMAAAKISPDGYIPKYLELGRWEGRTWALPTTPASAGLVYNKEHFRAKAGQLRAVGLDPGRAPRTIEELDRYAAVLNEFNADGSVRRMGFLPTEPGWFKASWCGYFGGSQFNEATGRVTADSEAVVRSMMWAKRYALLYGPDKLRQFKSGFGNFDSPQNAFIDGKVSMVMQGVWFPNFIRRHRPQMEFGVAPFPCAAGVSGPRTFIWSDMLAIPRGCKHPAEAWEFIRFTQGEGLKIICRLQGKNIPKALSAEEWAGFMQGHPNLELDVFQAVATSPHSFIWPKMSVQEQYNRELINAFEHIWSWSPPESKLAGLNGDARRARVEALCEAHVRETLAEVGRKIQRQLEIDELRRRQRNGESR